MSRPPKASQSIHSIRFLVVGKVCKVLVLLVNLEGLVVVKMKLTWTETTDATGRASQR